MFGGAGHLKAPMCFLCKTRLSRTKHGPSPQAQTTTAVAANNEDMRTLNTTQYAQESKLPGPLRAAEQNEVPATGIVITRSIHGPCNRQHLECNGKHSCNRMQSDAWVGIGMGGKGETKKTIKKA